MQHPQQHHRGSPQQQTPEDAEDPRGASNGSSRRSRSRCQLGASAEQLEVAASFK